MPMAFRRLVGLAATPCKPRRRGVPPPVLNRLEARREPNDPVYPGVVSFAASRNTISPADRHGCWLARDKPVHQQVEQPCGQAALVFGAGDKGDSAEGHHHVIGGDVSPER
jgi:hypothetical protein